MEIEHIDILLVEDNPHDADLAIMALEERNLANNVVWIDDGQDALDFIFAQGKYERRNIKQSPKLILLDLKMPKVDGLEILKEIKSNELTNQIPVVILTSSTEEEDMVRSYKLHVNSFVSKPVDFDEFSKVVADLGFYWMLVNQLP